MNSDKVKKISLGVSVIIAMILFLCLYLLGYGYDYVEDNDEKALNTKITAPISMKNNILRENKNIYYRYNPGKMSKVYINVFSTKDKDGKEYNFSDFDMIAAWNKDFNPVLDANVQFADKEEQPKEKSMSNPNASIRVRGNPQVPLKSYRIKLMDGFEGYEGQSVFNPDKNSNDPSRIANKLAHDLIMDLKHISGFRTSFFELYIRDDSLTGEDSEFHSYGLYTHIEQPNKAYLRSRGLDENGSLYRAEDFSFRLTSHIKNVDNPDYDEQAFEEVLVIREGKDHSKLVQMLQDINDESKDFEEVFHTYFNEDNYLTWLSINILLGNADGMTEGFLLYSPSNSLGFYLLPWDFDGIFRWMEDESSESDIYDSMKNVVLHRKYLSMDGSLEKLKARMEELVSDAFSPDRVKSLIKHYRPILLEMMNRYPDNVISPISLNEQMAYLKQIDERILINYNEFIKRYETGDD